MQDTSRSTRPGCGRAHARVVIALLLAAVPAVVGGDAIAQAEPPAPAPAPAVSPRVAALVSALELDASKSQEVASVLEAERARRRALFDATDPAALDRSSIEDLRESLRRIEAETRTSLATLLTAEEVERLDAARAEQRKHAGGELMAAKLTPVLGLSAEQEARVVPILAADLEARFALASEARGAGRGRGALRGAREELSALDESLDEQLAEVLDPEQQRAFTAWQKDQREKRRERFLDRRRER